MDPSGKGGHVSYDVYMVLTVSLIALFCCVCVHVVAGAGGGSRGGGFGRDRPGQGHGSCGESVRRQARGAGADRVPRGGVPSGEIFHEKHNNVPLLLLLLLLLLLFLQ